ncbi:6-hydroxymethylpterin diphosphokinase MptE-like protein [Methanobacterium sp.]|uniref:6-hydroxymethylpterin diphosphokinase MptE-like protein n=1 Tax=Methanobacterium sp. TaxID=2164 RepID=UPI002AB8A295|nr:6-hydroxymethylpterin diphosphokinase MptE-like protein [Methanobacterium sp.]MDY9922502.1 6-hydroxymethylpterin diphosphokinase MptE-like protein [Methanobacterium sp.]
MELTLWMQWYRLILEDFDFKREDDEHSAETLNNIIDDMGAITPQDIDINEKVIVFGAGPSLKPNLADLKHVDLGEFTLISADGATTALLEEGLVPDIIVTDLDGRMDDLIKANQQGALMVVHAHGNNPEQIEKYTPQLANVLGTTQSKPLASVYNFGGFTDGDRAVFLAMALGARVIVLSGMDFGKTVTHYSRPDQEDGPADKIKEKKLQWAKKLVQWAVINSDIQFLNISGGEKVEGVKDVDPRHL